VHFVQFLSFTCCRLRSVPSSALCCMNRVCICINFLVLFVFGICLMILLFILHLLNRTIHVRSLIYYQKQSMPIFAQRTEFKPHYTYHCSYDATKVNSNKEKETPASTEVPIACTKLFPYTVYPLLFNIYN
jgi:hypothetical protein